jgi:hypothetical protein
MKSNHKGNNNHKAGSVAALPTDYICIDENEAVKVMDYMSGSDAHVDEDVVADHLRLCFSCQEAVAALVSLNPAFRERLARLKQREPSLV